MDDKDKKIDIDNLELAPFRSRIKSFIIDDLLITLLVVLMFWEQVVASSGDMMQVMLIINHAVWEVMLIKFIYQTFFIWYYGATIGKIVAKIRVIDFDNYGRVTFLNAMVRSASRILSEIFFYIGFIVANFNDARQTFHDKFARTLVVNA